MIPSIRDMLLFSIKEPKWKTTFYLIIRLITLNNQVKINILRKDFFIFKNRNISSHTKEQHILGVSHLFFLVYKDK